jgi:calcineurin-like phosphoesterase family protein
LDGIMLVLCYYPFRTWNGITRGSINLHGHSHGRLKPLTRQYDVGVDSHNLQPVLLAELLAVKDVENV